MQEQVSNNLGYHYTSVDTFLKILDGIENGVIKMHASSIFLMNDPMEMYFGYSKMVDILPQIEERLLVDDDKYKLSCMWQGDFKFAHGVFQNRHLEKMKKTYRHPFIVSCSKNRDYLPLWKMYGDNGLGVSIGLDVRIYIKKTKEKDGTVGVDAPAMDLSAIRAIDVSYNNVPQLSVPFIMALYEYRQYLNKIQDVTNKEDIIDQQIGTLTRIMFYAAPFIKHNAYKYEKETRFIVEVRNTKDVKFKKNALGYETPYVEMELPLSCLKEIVIGPCCDFEMVKNLEKKMSKMRVEGINISPSSIPYRDSIKW